MIFDRRPLSRVAATTVPAILYCVASLWLTGPASRAEDADLVAHWKFDEEHGPFAVDSATGQQDRLVNPRWMPGVSGRALVLDGLTTCARRPAERAPQFSGPFTIEAWIAVQNYPWNWCPVAAQDYHNERGYSFGLDAEGHLGLQIWVGEWRTVMSSAVLPLRRWVHVACRFDGKGELVVYLRGSEAGRLAVEGDVRFARDQDLLIGRNHLKMAPTGRVGSENAHLPTYYSFDGAVDELKMYRRALSQDQIRRHAAEGRPASGEVLPRLVLPSGPPGAGRFGAFYAQLRYDEGWDALWRMGPYADVVVRFDHAPVRFVFWHGASYVPNRVTENGLWYNDEWVETSRHNVVGAAEPISDKQARYSHVRIIESHDARAVVHWRYAVNDVTYQIARVDPVSGWGDWGDEYYAIYPDGVAVRKVVLWSSQPAETHQFQESIVITQPGARPSDTVGPNAVTLANMKGETFTYSWLPSPPKSLDRPEEANIQLVNLKATYRPFSIVPPPVARITGYQSKGITEDTIFPWWNHWPVSQIPSAGRFARTPERPSHFSLAHIYWGVHEQTETSLTKIMLQGMTDRRAEELAPLARSWISPPRLRLTGSGRESGAYDPTQRAYVFSCSDGPCSFDYQVEASEASPMVNPAFVVRGWGDADAALRVNGEDVHRGKEFRVGHVSTLDGTDLVVWLGRVATTTQQMSLRPAGR